MSQVEAIEAQVGQLTAAIRKLSMIGAAVKIRNDQSVDPRISDLITSSANSILGGDVKTLLDQQAATLITMIQMSFAEAGELLHNAARPAEWHVDDPMLLQAQGQASSRVFHRILALSAARPLLQKAFQGRFLDVGTGVAGIALEAAKRYPTLLVDGIDVWEPALKLARRNVEESSYSGRITIRNLDVTGLAEDPVYTLVWLPTMFMKRTVVETALDRIAAASQRDAYLVAARYTVPADPEEAAFVALRTLRSGGEPIGQSEMEDMLRVRGFIDVESDVSLTATFTLGRRA